MDEKAWKKILDDEKVKAFEEKDILKNMKHNWAKSVEKNVPIFEANIKKLNSVLSEYGIEFLFTGSQRDLANKMLGLMGSIPSKEKNIEFDPFSTTLIAKCNCKLNSDAPSIYGFCKSDGAIEYQVEGEMITNFVDVTVPPEDLESIFYKDFDLLVKDFLKDYKRLIINNESNS